MSGHMNKPGYAEFKEGWVQFSIWKRVPTCGRAQAEQEFEDWYDEQRTIHNVWGAYTEARVRDGKME